MIVLYRFLIFYSYLCFFRQQRFTRKLIFIRKGVAFFIFGCRYSFPDARAPFLLVFLKIDYYSVTFFLSAPTDTIYESHKYRFIIFFFHSKYENGLFFYYFPNIYFLFRLFMVVILKPTLYNIKRMIFCQFSRKESHLYLNLQPYFYNSLLKPIISYNARNVNHEPRFSNKRYREVGLYLGVSFYILISAQIILGEW